MDREWYQKIDEWMDSHKEELAEDIGALVKIPSISDPENGSKEAPFGAACRDAMDEMLAMGRRYGFHTENYENYVGSIGNEKKNLKQKDGRLRLTLNIRYTITQDSTRMQELLNQTASSLGCDWEMERDSAPNYFPKEHPAVELLTNLYNELTGEHAKSFVMGGGTYARKLPNAFAYGIGSLREDDRDKAAKERIFLPGHGGAHEPDEGLNLRLLIKALKIYAKSIVALNECPL